MSVTIIIDSNSNKLYGEHCNKDGDCLQNMNYVCKNNVCSCSSTSYFASSNNPCGNQFTF